MEKKIGQYQKLSEKELSDEVTAQVEKLKKQGKWNKNKVEQLMGQVAPFLSAQQVLSLKNIIEGLE